MKGFSLLELMICISILGILAAVLVPLIDRYEHGEPLFQHRTYMEQRP